MLQDHGIWLCRSLTFGMMGKVNVQNHSPAGPPGGKSWWPLTSCQTVMYTMITIHNIQTFAKTKIANSQKTFCEGSQHDMNGLRNLNSLQGPLDRSPYKCTVYIYIYNLISLGSVLVFVRSKSETNQFSHLNCRVALETGCKLRRLLSTQVHVQNRLHK